MRTRNCTVLSAFQTSLSQAPQCTEEDTGRQKGWKWVFGAEEGPTCAIFLGVEVHSLSLTSRWKKLGWSQTWWLLVQTLGRASVFQLQEYFEMFLTGFQSESLCTRHKDLVLQSLFRQVLLSFASFVPRLLQWIAEVYLTRNLPKYFTRCVWGPDWPAGSSPPVRRLLRMQEKELSSRLDLGYQNISQQNPQMVNWPIKHQHKA